MRKYVAVIIVLSIIAIGEALLFINFYSAASSKPIDKDATYTWSDGSIITSDGRSFSLKRENLVDLDGKPIILLEAKQITDDTPSRDKMTDKQLLDDFWLRIQDQDIATLELVPSKYDNVGDYRKVYVTITESEAKYLQIPPIEMYKIKDGKSDKLAVPFWFILKVQERVSTAPVDKAHIDKVKALRKSEIPNG